MTRFTRANTTARFKVGERVKGIRKPDSEPKRRGRKRLPIDWDAVAEVLAKPVVVAERPQVKGGNTLPATGHCHECDRPVTGERRFCGRCLSKRRL